MMKLLAVTKLLQMDLWYMFAKNVGNLWEKGLSKKHFRRKDIEPFAA